VEGEGEVGRERVERRGREERREERERREKEREERGREREKREENREEILLNITVLQSISRLLKIANRK
jgi:hypothetical protein